MNIAELEELKRRLIENEISVEEAGKLVFISSTKSWHTKEWKEKRSKLLKDSCEQCLSTNPPLVIQHTWHPTPFETIRRGVTEKYHELIREKYPIESLVTEQEVHDQFNKLEKKERGVCPKCFSFNIRSRKTITPEYKCSYCKFETDELITKIVPIFVDNRVEETPNGGKNFVTYKSIAWNIYKEKSWNLLLDTYRKRIEFEALLIAIDESIRYQKLEDVITYCKKCAFLYDKRRKDLCPNCRKNYKSIFYSACYECNFEVSKNEEKTFVDVVEA